MFIELAELLRCPGEHEEQSFCVIVPEEMLDRDVRSGLIGCPVCRQEYPIVEGAALFGEVRAADDRLARPEAAHPTPEALQALLGVAGPGGYVVLVGSAATLAGPLGTLLHGIHVVVVNPPESVSSPGASTLYCRQGIPLRRSMARGVVVGEDHLQRHWIQEGARVLLNGLRLVVMSEEVVVDGVGQLAVGDGMWVGRKGEGGKGGGAAGGCSQ
jgi:hypothetical protein